MTLAIDWFTGPLAYLATQNVRHYKLQLETAVAVAVAFKIQRCVGVHVDRVSVWVLVANQKFQMSWFKSMDILGPDTTTAFLYLYKSFICRQRQLEQREFVTISDWTSLNDR
ncbi:unnamed protein product [Fusarium graminearum]|nr:unnamed protein product [Fusarium graminearum]VTO92316.1 unnamed protein product [Fusarium graminearum]